MIKEYAFGLNKRHYFQEEGQTSWSGTKSDTYCSLWDYDEYIKSYFDSHKVGGKGTLAGYDGVLYMPGEFILDVDGSTVDEARQKTIALVQILDDLNITRGIYFSGRGFHVGVPSNAFRWKPSKDLHVRVKDALGDHGIYDIADPSVTDKTRLIRLVNTMNTKSGLWKVAIPESMLYADTTEITDYAKEPRPSIEYDTEIDPVFDLTGAKRVSGRSVESQGRTPDPANYPCISSMLDGSHVGMRHATALRLASWFRWRYPEDVVRVIMENWRAKVTDASNEFTKSEMDNIVESAYSGHGGSGNRYGCRDEVMDAHCHDSCRLFKMKKSVSVMDAKSMSSAFMDFIQSDHNTLDLGEIYGGYFPIYPGELVIVVGAPKSMKTTLVQSWLNHFKRPSYIMEGEMSPRQIWSNFLMMQHGWDKNDLIKEYQTYESELEKDYGWLTVDYSMPFVHELEKRVSLLSEKPEIVFIDHLGLMRSNKESLEKMEEMGRELSQFAVKNNLIVVAISETTKSAIQENGRFDITAPKGALSLSYNANKVLSVYAKKVAGKVERLKVETLANREEEDLNVLLRVEKGKRLIRERGTP